jgi:cysteinyl-tRNA synthetase
MLKIHNSLTRTKEEFIPLDPQGQRVGMYYCGPTVYDSLHIGHARAAIVPDMLRRYIEHKGWVVRYVANFTDIDDKIIRRALKERRPWREVTVTYMEEYYRQMALLGNRPVDVHPRATDHIPEMIELIERLIASGNAYVATDGDVYFDTASYQDYGALSGRHQEDQDAGRSGRISEEELALKKNPTDFILWKIVSNDPPEWQDQPEFVPSWASPWGKGRPGWHIECSAISRKYLGMPFDLHGGGRDLLFPHHENEKAQNDCGYHHELDGEPSVRYWLHNGFITLKARTEEEQKDSNTEGDQSKMSKSLGNVFWIRDVVWPHGPFDPMALRLLILGAHYRSPLQYAPELLEQTAARMERIYSLLDKLRDGLDAGIDTTNVEGPLADAARQARVDFEAAMDDDFNTPGALAAISELISAAQKALNEGVEPPARALALRTLESLLQTLGFRSERSGQANADTSREKQLLDLFAELRLELRAAKSYALSDKVRDRLQALGFAVSDQRG